MSRWQSCLGSCFVGFVFFVLASCATQPKPSIPAEQATSPKEIKNPLVASVDTAKKIEIYRKNEKKSSQRKGQIEKGQGQAEQAVDVTYNPNELTEVKETKPGVGHDQKGEGEPEEGADDRGGLAEEGEPLDTRGETGVVWQTDQLSNTVWQFEKSGGVLRVGKKDESHGETPGLFEDAIIQNRVRSVLIAAGHPEAAESVRVSGGVVAMVLDPEEGGERLLSAIEAAFSVVGVQRVEISPRF